MATQHSFQDRVRQLKQLLQTEDDFSRTYTYFFDHLGMNRAFIQCGKSSKNDLVKKAVKKACQDFVGKDATLSKLMIAKVAAFDLYHGSFIIGGKPGVFFYFNDILMGMIMIMNLDTGRTSSIRFRGVVIPGDGVTVVTGNDTVQ